MDTGHTHIIDPFYFCSKIFCRLCGFFRYRDISCSRCTYSNQADTLFLFFILYFQDMRDRIVLDLRINFFQYLVLMLGCGLRWNATMTASRAEAEQAKTRLREMESRNHIAEAIHDAVTGDLSAAAFVAQRRIDALSGGDDGDGSASTDGDDGKNADERRDELDKWTQVNDYILSALTNVHRVIDELDMDVTVLEEDADGKAFSDLLKATMAGDDRRLRALGFDITSILHVAGGAPSASPSLAGIANDLLRETYANIARHAQSGSKADLSVILKPNAVEITQINQARTTETDRTQPGGHGLAYFSKQLESHGGKLETTLRDGEWTLFAYLPIPVPETLPPLAGHPES